jgi:hypothetical protein
MSIGRERTSGKEVENSHCQLGVKPPEGVLDMRR